MTDLRAVVFQRIQYAKTDSEVIAKVKGTYGDKEKKKEKKKKALEQSSNLTKKPAAVSEALSATSETRDQYSSHVVFRNMSIK